jgi:hypothetical protein
MRISEVFWMVFIRPNMDSCYPKWQGRGCGGKKKYVPAQKPPPRRTVTKNYIGFGRHGALWFHGLWLNPLNQCSVPRTTWPLSIRIMQHLPL